MANGQSAMTAVRSILEAALAVVGKAEGSEVRRGDQKGMSSSKSLTGAATAGSGFGLGA